MNDQEREPTGEDFEVSVSEAPSRRGAHPAEDGRAARSPFQPHLTPRQRAVRIGSAAGVIVLALLVLVGSVPSLRDSTVGLFTRLIPTPTATLVPGSDLFFMLPNPPGTTVLLDGRPLTHLPLPGGPPLALARGRHQLDWRPGPFPFPPLSCILSVPRTNGDTCSLVPAYALPMALQPKGDLALHVSVINLRESLTTLPADVATALTTTTQAALDAIGSSATVQPGESYYYYQSGVSGHAVTATQPLRATLSLQLGGPLAFGGCVVTAGAVQPCRGPGQECNEFCTLSGAASAGAGPAWIAGAVVSSFWSYTTLDGKVVARDIGDFGLNSHLVVLRITWDGTHWHVMPVLGHQQDLPAADDVVCAAARDWLASGPLSYVFRPTSQRTAVGYASGPATIDGCAVRITGYDQTGIAPSLAGPALFLERFGVLLAANDVAHALWPDLPRADPSEVALAQQLASQLT